MNSFADIVNLWETAEQLGVEIGVSGITTRQWRNRDSIPATQWAAVIAAAQRRGFHEVTLERLSEIAARGAKHKPRADAGPTEAVA